MSLEKKTKLVAGAPWLKVIKKEVKRRQPSDESFQFQLAWLRQFGPAVKNETDSVVNIRIRLIRHRLWLSEAEFGALLGLSAKQVSIMARNNYDTLSPTLKEILLSLDQAPNATANLLLDCLETQDLPEENKVTIAKIRQKLRWYPRY